MHRHPALSTSPRAAGGAVRVGGAPLLRPFLPPTTHSEAQGQAAQVAALGATLRRLSWACPVGPPAAHRHHRGCARWLRLEGHCQLCHGPFQHRDHGWPWALTGKGKGAVPCVPRAEGWLGGRRRPWTAGAAQKGTSPPNPRDLLKGVRQRAPSCPHCMGWRPWGAASLIPPTVPTVWAAQAGDSLLGFSCAH